jgi:predicted NBD/HSP70 family sugar kinase
LELVIDRRRFLILVWQPTSSRGLTVADAFSKHLSGADGTEREPALPAFSRLGGGANQAGGRAYNERLAISLIRLNGPLPKAELARLTGLSAQTMSQIVRRLERDGLLIPQPRLRGRVGQPSVPYALNPLGALSLGVKIGRRSTDVVLCNFLGDIMDRDRRAYPHPAPDAVLAFVSDAIERMKRTHEQRRFAGVGVAMPFELWKWSEDLPTPTGDLDNWRHIDVASELSARTGLPCYLANDATAACGAELAYSHRGSNIDMLYLFIGSFAGGGVVLDGALRQGRTGNAGALGSMPMARAGREGQLIHHASLLMLERRLVRDGVDAAILQDPDADWSGLGEALAGWIDSAADALAHAIISGAAVFDFGHVCIDGALPRDVLGQLVAKIEVALARHDLQGLSAFRITAGSLGADARVLGGAMLPIVENFASGQDVLLKALGPPP